MLFQSGLCIYIVLHTHPRLLTAIENVKMWANQTESLQSSSISSWFSSKYTSVVKETSVSWADSKFVMLRVGIPKHLITENQKQILKIVVYEGLCV